MDFAYLNFLHIQMMVSPTVFRYEKVYCIVVVTLGLSLLASSGTGVSLGCQAQRDEVHMLRENRIVPVGY